MKFCANISILFTEVPLLERFAAARERRLRRRRAVVAARRGPRRRRGRGRRRGRRGGPAELRRGRHGRRRPRADQRPGARDDASGPTCRSRSSWPPRSAAEAQRARRPRADRPRARGQLELARDNVALRRRRARREQGAEVADRGRQHVRERPVPALRPRATRRPSCAPSAATTCGCSTTPTTCSAWRGTSPRRSSEHLERDRPRPDRRPPGRGEPGTGEINYDYVSPRSTSSATTAGSASSTSRRRRHRGEPGVAAARAARTARGPERRCMPETIGFIGLGVMGAPMARNLVEAGHASSSTTARARASTRRSPRRGPRRRRARARSPSGRRGDHDAARLAGRRGRRSATTACWPARRGRRCVIDMSTIHPTVVGRSRRGGRRARHRPRSTPRSAAATSAPSEGDAVDHGRRRRGGLRARAPALRGARQDDRARRRGRRRARSSRPATRSSSR